MEDRAVIGLITSRKTDAGERVINPNIEKAIRDLGGEIRPFNFEKLHIDTSVLYHEDDIVKRSANLQHRR